MIASIRSSSYEIIDVRSNMPITFPCACGQSLQVKDEHAGRKTRCPVCRNVMQIPVSEIAEFDIEVLESPPPKSSIKAKPPPLPWKREAGGESEDKPPPLPWKHEADDESEDEPPPIRRRKKRRRPRSEERSWSLPSMPRIAISSTIWAGLAMMVGAVVWFVVGLAVGYIFFYPPIMFVLGVLAFFRGLMGQED
jgi:hypothetical protein